MSPKFTAKSLEIQGIVQGVGFRPFIYQLAERYCLKGEVANTSSGVWIHIEGEDPSVEAFCADVVQKKPALCHITEILTAPAEYQKYSDFRIGSSKAADQRSALISPDVTVCQDCLKEMFDPADRRHRYPFINCTNCGPRYTIIMDIPYDRFKTSMKVFTMCAQCLAEYHNPLDRRFHAQPNACPVCGPQLGFYERSGAPIAALDPIAAAVAWLQQGRILAIKGLGGFHLAADAMNHEAVKRLRRLKIREEKPFAVMCPDLETISAIAHIDQAQAELLSSLPRPIVLLKKRMPEPLSPAVAPDNRHYGVMLPYTPLHYLLLTNNFEALVMTSGNLSDEPIVIDNRQAFLQLGDIAEAFLIHNRDIYLRCDDSVVMRAAEQTRPIRRSRGYAPMPMFINKQIPQVLAVGAELKNTITLTKNKQAFVSQHIGDLENLETYDYFRQTIEHLRRILDIRPEIIAHDLHPDYLSTRFAMEQTELPAIGVQHHHAHIVSCMAENRHDGPVIGLSFDGAGYGRDHCVWGGEVLIAELGGFERVGHLEYVPMPGSAAAIRQPWRMGLAYLYHTFGASLAELETPILTHIDQQRLPVILSMIDKQLNCPLTSSLGRLFDGVAAILGLYYTVTYEGQAAMAVERTAANGHFSSYDYEFTKNDRDGYLIPVRHIIRGVVADLAHRVPVPAICGKFQQTLANLFTDVCAAVKHDAGISTVALSGGVFQNERLLTDLIKQLSRRGFKVLTHQQLPTNDGGISLGQALVAASMKI